MKMILFSLVLGINASYFPCLFAEEQEKDILKEILYLNKSGTMEDFKQKHSESDIVSIFKLPFDKKVSIENRKVIIALLSKLSKDKYIDMCVAGLKMQKLEDEIKFALLLNALSLCLDKNSSIDDKDGDKLIQGIAASLDLTNNTDLRNAMRESTGVIINRNIYSELTNNPERRERLIEDILYGTKRSIFSKLGKVKVINKDYLKELVESLSNDDPKIRMNAAIELKNATGKDFGFNPVADQKQRDEAIKRWLEYIDEFQKIKNP